MKTAKVLNLFLDGRVFHTTRVRVPDDGSDIRCPACYFGKFRDLVTITQHGFSEDDCLSIIQCGNCGNEYHVQYTISASGEVK